MRVLKNLIFFDLEGPLSPQDNAYEVMGLLPDGRKIFETISRYDDILALEGREDYEPGDTLALVVPFLIYHGIREKDIKHISSQAYMVPGARELIAQLLRTGWEVFVVSTSYEQHARSIASRLGLGPEQVVCTPFPLDELERQIKKEELDLLAQVELEIVERLYHEDLGTGKKDGEIKAYLDWFYWDRLARTNLGVPNGRIQVVGGRRKVWAIERVAVNHNTILRDVAFVGDSITDAQAAKVVEASGGLSIAFNGNAFVIPYATVGVASTSLASIEPILYAWVSGGRAQARGTVRAMRQPQTEAGPYYHWLVGERASTFDTIVNIHRKTRGLVRAQAAKLG